MRIECFCNFNKCVKYRKDYINFARNKNLVINVFQSVK